MTTTAEDLTTRLAALAARARSTPQHLLVHAAMLVERLEELVPERDAAAAPAEADHPPPQGARTPMWPAVSRSEGFQRRGPGGL